MLAYEKGDGRALHCVALHCISLGCKYARMYVCFSTIYLCCCCCCDVSSMENAKKGGEDVKPADIF